MVRRTSNNQPPTPPKGSGKGKHSSSPAKAKKRTNPVVKALGIVALVLVVAFVGVGAYAFSLLNKMSTAGEGDPIPGQASDFEEIPTDSTPGPSISSKPKNDKITNIVLFGLDTRSMNELKTGNTDSIIIVTLDEIHHKVKLTSVMRDVLVRVPGKNFSSRINSLNNNIGTAAAAQAIGDMFGIPVDYYAVMNFNGVAKVIETLGGVDIELTSKEANYLNNDLFNELRQLFGANKVPNVPSSGGMTHLNGYQALGYMRIRKIGNSDFERTDRQRKVMQEVFKGLKTMGLTDMMALVPTVSDMVRTDMTSTQILNTAQILYGLRDAEFEDLRVPVEGSYKGTKYKGQDVIEIDFQKNSDAIHQLIYEDN